MSTKPRFYLSAEERTLLALYRAAPASTQTVVGGLLFQSWIEPLPHEREAAAARFSRASRELKIGVLPVSALKSHKVPAMTWPARYGTRPAAVRQDGAK